MDDELGKLLFTEQAVALMVSELGYGCKKTLSNMSLRGDGPPYIRRGKRKMYPEKPYRDWLKAIGFNVTTEPLRRFRKQAA